MTAARASWRGIRIFTIGHSTRTLDELVALLRGFGVSTLVDLRTIPRSRHNPQFDRDALRAALPARGLRYVHLPELGGLRRARADSPNAGWRNASFRGFADYSLTPEFEAGLAKLHALALTSCTALMCAEAVPWRCHRSLIADALTARGARVEHVTGPSRSTPHRLTPFARVEGTRVTYPREEAKGIITEAPFHLEATVRVLQRLPTNRVDLWEHDRYRRVFATSDGLALVEVVNRGTIDAPSLAWTVLRGEPSAAARAALEQTLRRVLGLDAVPDALQRLARAEPALRPSAEALRGLRPPRFPELFETFANVVPFQQVSLDAGVAVVGRLVERFGAALEHDGRRQHAFPDVRVVAEARVAAIRACGTSLRKAETLRGIARAIVSGEVTEEKLASMASAEAVRRLCELPGIGPWSASLVLLRGLGRLDVFPPGDVGAARRVRSLLELPPRASVDRVVRRLGDERGQLYFCALGAALLARSLIHPAPARDR